MRTQTHRGIKRTIENGTTRTLRRHPWKSVHIFEFIFISLPRPAIDVIDPTDRSYRALNSMPKLIKPIVPAGFDDSRNSKLNKPDYKVWLQWWKEHFTTEDYFKYLTSQVWFQIYFFGASHQNICFFFYVEGQWFPQFYIPFLWRQRWRQRTVGKRNPATRKTKTCWKVRIFQLN